MSKEDATFKNYAPIRRVMDDPMRERISQSFRATKPLLGFKRQLENHDHLLYKTRNSRQTASANQLTNITRVPLKEISKNTQSPCSLSGFKSPNGCNEGLSVHRSDLYRKTLNTKATPISAGSEHMSDPFITPVKQPDWSNLSDSYSTPSLLDDEFDETILTEIDAIYQQKSAAKSECRTQSLSISFYDENQCGINRTSNLAVSTGTVAPNGNVKVNELESVDALEFTEGDSNALKIIQNGSMPAEYTKYLISLNERQREAACSDISVPLMIAAGPGSGKTSTMVGRVLMLLNEGIHQSNILAMTFTTAAASEMRDRIGAVAGKATAKELTISTFHSFSLQLCRSHAEKLERTPEFLIYGHGQQRRAIIEAVRLFDNENNKQNDDDCQPGDNSNETRRLEYFKDKSKRWLKYVTQAKAFGRTPAECNKLGDKIGAAILAKYNDILKSCNALDYHDLISCSVRLLSDFPEVFKECQDSCKAIIIDEFQDTSTMQYNFLRILASHNRVTIVGDDDQSIFSFNGADSSGFDSFRKDFSNHKEIRLVKNYRSTRCIVEAASSIIRNNKTRCQSKTVLTENSQGSKITIKECHSEDAQCAFVIDKILEIISNGSADKPCYGNIAVLYRRQISGKVFQTAFRDRKIPFNVHGVAFYRKKVVRAIIALLRTTLPGCDDGSYRRVFKALLPFDKDEKNMIINHIEKVSDARKCSFISASRDIFSAKVSGTFKRAQLTQGRKVLSTIEMISNLVHREQSLSAVITSVANMVPQKYLLEQRAVINNDGGKLLNEDNDLRSVLHYLLDDVTDFLSSHFSATKEETLAVEEQKGCMSFLKAFVEYVSERESENFRSRRHDNKNSITLTTIHQSKGLEWDTVFIVKANESEIPLLHEHNGISNENGTSIEEERRLFYVAMTRARKKLLILYVMMDTNWQMLQPSRFVNEIPGHLREVQDEISITGTRTKNPNFPEETTECNSDVQKENKPSEVNSIVKDLFNDQTDGVSKVLTDTEETYNGNSFVRRFNVEERSVVSHLFHQWAKKKAFQDPRRLLDKVRFVIDERLTIKNNKHKNVLRELKSSLSCNEAFHYAEYVLRWEQIPADQRAHLMREKQEHFMKLRIENSMSSTAATTKQVSYLQSLGCTIVPISRLHASHLIEQYKSL